MHLQVTGWSVDWIILAQDSDKWPDLVNTVNKLRLQKMRGNP